MIELLTGLFISALAGNELVELWRHGSIFARLRAGARSLRSSTIWPLTTIGELLGCPFCLSLWTAMISWGAWLHGGIAAATVAGLAVAKLSNLLNDLTHSWLRSPPTDPEDMSFDEDQSLSE